MTKLPHANKAFITYIATVKSSKEFLKETIEIWIDENLLPKLEEYKPYINVKEKFFKGQVVAVPPYEYHQNEKEWKAAYEEIIRPLGYLPVYGGGLGLSRIEVGISWKLPL